MTAVPSKPIASTLTLNDTLHDLAKTTGHVNAALRSTMKEETLTRQKEKLARCVKTLEVLKTQSFDDALIGSLSTSLTAVKERLKDGMDDTTIEKLKAELRLCAFALYRLNSSDFDGLTAAPEDVHFTHITYTEPDFEDGAAVEIDDRSQKCGIFRVFKDTDMHGRNLWRFCVTDEDGTWNYPGLKSAIYLERLQPIPLVEYLQDQIEMTQQHLSEWRNEHIPMLSAKGVDASYLEQSITKYQEKLAALEKRLAVADPREDGLPLDKKIAVKGFCDVWLSDAMIEKLWQSMNARKQLMKQVGLPPDWADGPIDMNSGKAPCTPGVRKILDSLSPEQSRILTRSNSISNELVGNGDFNLEVTHHCDGCGRVAANLEWTEDEDVVQISFLEHER